MPAILGSQVWGRLISCGVSWFVELPSFWPRSYSLATLDHFAASCSRCKKRPGLPSLYSVNLAASSTSTAKRAGLHKAERPEVARVWKWHTYTTHAHPGSGKQKNTRGTLEGQLGV